MLPNEVLTPEDRMAEIEEASMLLAMTVSGETREEDRPQTQARLAYLFQRMSDRLAARDVAEKIRERDAFQAKREMYRKAHEDGRLMEYHCSESGEHAMFIDGQDDMAHRDWLDKHADAVLLLNTGGEGYKFKVKAGKPVTVTEDREL